MEWIDLGRRCVEYAMGYLDHLIIDYVPPSLRPYAGYVPSVGRFLLLRMLNPVTSTVYRLRSQLWLLSRTPFKELSMQDIVPPILTLICIYLAIMSLWRTTRFAMSFFMWFTRWGLLLILLTGGYTWFTGGGQRGGREAVVDAAQDILRQIGGDNRNQGWGNYLTWGNRNRGWGDDVSDWMKGLFEGNELDRERQQDSRGKRKPGRTDGKGDKKGNGKTQRTDGWSDVR